MKRILQISSACAWQCTSSRQLRLHWSWHCQSRKFRNTCVRRNINLELGWAISSPRDSGPRKHSEKIFKPKFLQLILICLPVYHSKCLVLRLTWNETCYFYHGLSSISIGRCGPPLKATLSKWPPRQSVQNVDCFMSLSSRYLDKAGTLFRNSAMQREMLLPVPKHPH